MKTLEEFQVANESNNIETPKGSQANPYTVEEYEILSNNHEWPGGFVEELGMMEEILEQQANCGYYSPGENGGDIDLTNINYFERWYDNANCFQLSSSILAHYNINSSCSFEEAIHIASYNNGNFSYGDKNQSSTDFNDAITCIDDHLRSLRPIMVGVRYSDATSQGPNLDGTNHFIVITGKVNGAYRFMDCGTSLPQNGCSPANLLYIDFASRQITGQPSFQNGRSYIVTQIRTNL